MDFEKGAESWVVAKGFDAFGVGLIDFGDEPDEVIVKIGYKLKSIYDRIDWSWL